MALEAGTPRVVPLLPKMCSCLPVASTDRLSISMLRQRGDGCLSPLLLIPQLSEAALKSHTGIRIYSSPLPFIFL